MASKHPDRIVDIFPTNRRIDDSYYSWVKAARILIREGKDPFDPASASEMNFHLAAIWALHDLAEQSLAAPNKVKPTLCDE